MKILDKYILKSFLVPFIATFLIVLFVLVMQALWQAFENIAGKGISVIFILKFLYYTTLMIIPQALPIGVLLSSIMALGNLGENYEFAAAKSAGVSLQRLVRPIGILAIALSGLNFLFLNNVFPYANQKQRNLYLNIKKKKPALALVPGSFNADIPGYQIKFDEKYGEEENLLKKVLIYDLTSNRGNQKVITAESGKIVTEEGSRYMTFILYNGNYYEEHVKTARTTLKRKKMAASSATFKEYEFNIDIGDTLDEGQLDSINSATLPMMLTLEEIKDTIPKLKINYDEVLELRAKNIYISTYAKDLYKYPDSLVNKSLDSITIDNFELQEKITILNSALTKSTRVVSTLNNNLDSIKWNRKMVNFYDTEYYNRVAFSLSCVILFFIGAPLGSIIRKGGFGLPMILAIAVYVLYFFTNTFGKNLAEESSISSMLGSWISAILMIPFAILLTNRATKDKGIFNLNSFLQPVTNFFKKILPKKGN
ncbi:LptF/LptG family permease [Polaribacter dokdonensis]|uniref:Lipopolysaccharide export system permease protein n=1 Tax=Polaribacter dokdonensis DSW-5 TaxID=1300348 RepID=A0A0N0CG10_9FLAO|nr:LptF/LptG family permease [Polaribacter dokdonensis]KOY52597.1 putative permease YjgP/YjgQ family [Polaribacter dokdonensis DSW-5]SEE48680.1 lipopolysaccharide export system permease protein [Polaribacter dokdonensis DSW-5]